MEQYDNQYDNKDIKKVNLYESIDSFKSFISTFMGVIVAFIGIALIFVVSSLEGSKEIKASNKENAVIMGMWREQNASQFPEDKVDIIRYNDKDFYFVVDKVSEDGTILKWYFAYDGGLGYVFSDYKFYILTSITIMIAVFVAHINYTTSINSTKNTTKFLKTLKAYQDTKNKVVKHTQYIPMFCAYKNKQLYEDTKREIVESADINYEFYISDKFDKEKLEKWQLEILDNIKKIKIKRISSSDLLQEKSGKAKTVSLLPISPEEHKKNYNIRSIVQKIVSSCLSGLTVAFGIVLGNWVLGITYGFTVLVSFIMANITGVDYANNGLRQRYIAKADLLNEFDNMIDYFIAQEKELLKKEENPLPKTYPLVVVNKK